MGIARSGGHVMASTKSTPPPSAADMLEKLAKDLRETAGKLLAGSRDAEELAKLFRGEKP
jgi:hypothetical protein